MWIRIILAQLRFAHHENVQSCVVRHISVLISSYCTQVDTSLDSQVREVVSGCWPWEYDAGDARKHDTINQKGYQFHNTLSCFVKEGQDTA